MNEPKMYPTTIKSKKMCDIRARYVSNVTKSKRGIARNYLVVWVDGSIDSTNEDCQNTLTHLRCVVNEINMYTTPGECIEFLNHIDDEKVFVISSGTLGQHLVSNIHNKPQVDVIYIYCSNKSCHETWSKEWTKIRGVFTSIQPICESLKQAVREYDHDTISMSFVTKSTMTAVVSGQQTLDQLPPTFMYSSLFKEIILEINDDNEKSLKDLVTYCRDKNVSEKEVRSFQLQYQQNSPIWWYTREIFLYGMLNHALRSLNMETMIKLGFFIRHLHQQLEQLYEEQKATYGEKFIVYRGQGLCQEYLEHLRNTKGGLLSFNNFLSTSMIRSKAMEFAKRALDKSEDSVAIIFGMTIDPSTILASKIPFALIEDFTAVKGEQEILFSMNTIFRVDEIKQAVEHIRLWEVQLTITDDNDTQLVALMKRIGEEISGTTEWHRIGDLMIKVGHFDLAEELYNELLQNESSECERALVYHCIGVAHNGNAEYNQAIVSFEKALGIYEKTCIEDDPKVANTHNQMGRVYCRVGDYSKALEYFEKARRIREKALCPIHSDLAISYNNIGLVYNLMGDYSKALEYYGEAYKIYDIAFPTNHPELAVSYNNFVLAYYNMGDYSMALDYLQKSLKIRETALPDDHPDLAFPYIWFGRVYESMKDYLKALSNFEKCLKIRQQKLPEKHPDIALAYAVTGNIHRLLGDYEKALSFLGKALDIQEAVQCNPLHCATTYIYLGETYCEMKDYTIALEYLEKGIKIRKSKLPKDHPDLATSYHSISKFYLATEQYELAKQNIQQTIEIAQKKLLSNHPDLLAYRETFEKIRKAI